MAKRVFDFTAASLGLIVLAPLFLVVGVVIRATSPGPVFFRQERVGRYGRLFHIYKFRTMLQDAEALGGQLTIADDPRVTHVGAFLRRTKVDELAQLINVVRGEMSLVGPRPEVPRFVAHYDDHQRRVLSVLPGVTDPASISYADESELLRLTSDPEGSYIHQVLPRKLEMNLAYIERCNLMSDLGVILSTLGHLVRKATRARYEREK